MNTSAAHLVGRKDDENATPKTASLQKHFSQISVKQSNSTTPNAKLQKDHSSLLEMKHKLSDI
jgi:hypothetical protein